MEQPQPTIREKVFCLSRKQGHSKNIPIFGRERLNMSTRGQTNELFQKWRSSSRDSLNILSFGQESQNISELGRIKSNVFFCWVEKEKKHLIEKVEIYQNLVETVKTYPSFDRKNRNLNRKS